MLIKKGPKTKKNSAGFTLLETVVALGILIIALTSAVSLAVISLRLIESSRSQTEANALVQKGLADNIAKADCGCGASTPAFLYVTTPYQWVGQDNVTYTLSVTDPTSVPGFSLPSDVGSQSISNGDFWKITSTVTWGSNHISSTEYARRSQ